MDRSRAQPATPGTKPAGNADQSISKIRCPMMADSGLCFDVLSNGAAPEMAIGYKCTLLDQRSLRLAAHAIITVRPDGRLVRLNRMVPGVGTHRTFKRASNNPAETADGRGSAMIFPRCACTPDAGERRRSRAGSRTTHCTTVTRHAV